ncbi:bifunctional acetate--CoA ligase family protein/GNAT family N-acetyltransferase [Desulfolutivibrio sulfoxidireducens]|uniref:bifunctional acetate--CoA ligase family protein/GNAT family N-acetyltransferase n=1 Tax=Desulfolutivibrio sulfoxidireducens TaxID=2773299 RepID=UPI00159D7730|nr:bifunctional acetate--CoA ligase family protein/GNAT family N-acetyltransferase [Desulfolutivibrio sulfoxidireducens]QLA17613.1 GNAT family N-acetyltransferase [Desulfolutivibrio sulfoxidireducens]QLA21189.1 GNAT family N-acetyltransferase [Desulfolutivibrio sulfoxidireducens]
MSISNLDSLFKPNSVAVIGATNEPGHVGAVLMKNLLGGKFLGPVMPVNPGLDAVSGVLAYKSVDTMPLTPDLGVICTPPETAPEYLKDLGKRGTRAAVVLSPGYHKLSRQDKKGLQTRMIEAAAPYGVRILGPSGLGLIIPGIGLNCSLAASDAKPGRIAFISQSASLFTAVLDWAGTKGIGFSYIVSLGDRADLTYGDIIDYLSSDPHTRSILLYVEAVTNARAFMSASRAAARNKPVLVIKPGRMLWTVTPPGPDEGRDEVYDEAFRRGGMLRVFEIDALFDAAQTLARSRPLRGDRLAILTNGGSVGMMAADALLAGGGKLADFSDETKKALDDLLGSNWLRDSIIDMSFDAEAGHYEKALRILLKEPGVNAILIIHVPFASVSGLEAARAAATVLGKSSRTVLACWMGYEQTGEEVRVLSEAGIPTYDTPDKAVGAFVHLVRHRRNQELLMEMPASLPTDFYPDLDAAKAVVSRALAEGREDLSEPEAKAVLAAYGVPAIASRVARDAGDAVAQATALGFPVAIKILSPDIPQPFDVGGIALDLETPEAVRESAESILVRVAGIRPDARVEGFIVQEMGRRLGARELFIQARVDPVFGPCVVFGQGGLSGRTTRDKAVALPPLNMPLARDLIFRTRISAYLAGTEADPGVDIDAICLTLIQVSQLITDVDRICAIDVNPLLADAKGVVVLGARVRIDVSREPDPHRLAIRPYPRELEECTVLKNGRKVLLRPIRPEDEPAHFEFFKRLSPEDLRFRFFGVVRELSHMEMARLTQIDYEREMAFIATAPGDDGKPETLGVVRASTKPDNSSAEFAIIVRSDQKGHGLGRMLMEKMVRYCRERGTRILSGQALLENAGMQGLAHKLGFDVSKNFDEEVAEMILDLQAPTPSLPRT